LINYLVDERRHEILENFESSKSEDLKFASNLSELKDLLMIEI